MNYDFNQRCKKVIESLETFKTLQAKAEDAREKYTLLLQDLEDYACENYGEDSSEFELIYDIDEYIMTLEHPKGNIYYPLESHSVDKVINKLQRGLEGDLKEETASYENETKQGYKILNKLKDPNGRLYIVFKRGSDYCYACGYDVTDGTWAQGGYSWNTEEGALEALLKEKAPLRLTSVDDLTSVKTTSGKYSTTTSQNFEILDQFVDDRGDKFVVCYRPNVKDYCFGTYYDDSTGTWAQGYYDYSSREKALNDLKSYLKTKKKTLYSEVHKNDRGTFDHTIY